jgi:hypothetical protein
MRVRADLPADANAPKKHRGHEWKTGESGNPRGKLPGTKHRVTLMAERLMEGAADAVVQAVIRSASEGDMTAARLVLERISPLRRGRPVALDLLRIRAPADVLAALDAVTASAGAGELTAEEGQAVAAIVEGQRRAIEIVDLEQRIARLEARENEEKR